MQSWKESVRGRQRSSNGWSVSFKGLAKPSINTSLILHYLSRVLLIFHVVIHLAWIWGRNLKNADNTILGRAGGDGVGLTSDHETRNLSTHRQCLNESNFPLMHAHSLTHSLTQLLTHSHTFVQFFYKYELVPFGGYQLLQMKDWEITISLCIEFELKLRITIKHPV